MKRWYSSRSPKSDEDKIQGAADTTTFVTLCNMTCYLSECEREREKWREGGRE